MGRPCRTGRASRAEHRRAALTSSFSSWPSFSSPIHLLPVASCRHAKDGRKSCQEEKPRCRGSSAGTSIHLGLPAVDVTLTSPNPRGTVATPAPPTPRPTEPINEACPQEACVRRAQVHAPARVQPGRSEEHTSELQSLAYLVCRLLLEKKKKKDQIRPPPPPTSP